MKPQEKDFASHVAYTRALEAYCDGLVEEIAHVKEVEFPRKTEAVAAGWRSKLAVAQKKADDLEKFIEGKNGYKERIAFLYEENLRLGNEQIDLADKIREECAHVCDIAGNNHQGGFSCAAAIRATKERP